MTMTDGKYILDEAGDVKQVDTLEEWAKWMEKPDNGRVLKQDKIGSLFISTVFLGLDYAFSGGAPILFETMVFDESKKRPDGGSTDVYQERYVSKTLALENHARLVEDITKGKDITNYDD